MMNIHEAVVAANFRICLL